MTPGHRRLARFAAAPAAAPGGRARLGGLDAAGPGLGLSHCQSDLVFLVCRAELETGT